MKYLIRKIRLRKLTLSISDKTDELILQTIERGIIYSYRKVAFDYKSYFKFDSTELNYKLCKIYHFLAFAFKFSLALILVLCTKNSILQISLIIAILLISTLINIKLRPHKNTINNIFLICTDILKLNIAINILVSHLLFLSLSKYKNIP